MSTNLKCRSCKSQLFEPLLLSYKDSPISAQDFHNDPDQKDNNVNLDIYQCSKCNLVQHILDPVPYYKEVIRAVSVSKEMENFRIQQFKEWIELNKLSNKKVKEIKWLDSLQHESGQTLSEEKSEEITESNDTRRSKEKHKETIIIKNVEVEKISEKEDEEKDVDSSEKPNIADEGAQQITLDL